MPLIIHAAQGWRESISLFGTDYATPDGTCVRDYVHVTDLARAHVLAYEYLAKGGTTSWCNLGTGQGNSVNEVIEAVTRITRKNFEVRIGDRRQGDPAFLVADSTKAKTLLGWQPEKKLDDIVTSAWQWHQSPRYS